MAVSGDTVVVGAFHESDKAYVFVKPAGGWAGLLTEATPVACE